MTMAKEAEKNVRECTDVVTRTTLLFTVVSEILSVLIFLGGCVVLLGWAMDIPALKSVFQGLVTMKANTALCFIFSGLSLWLLQLKRKDSPFAWPLGLVCGLMVLGIGLLSLSQYVFGRDLGIDQLLFQEPPGAILTSSQGRMAFNTAINFTITGLVLSLMASKAKHRCLFFQILMLPVGIISILAFIGYLYKASPLALGLDLSTAMALHTMVLFIALFFGVLFCRPGCGLMTPVSSDTIGGKLIRRLFPVAVLVPLILGWLKLQGERSGVISNEFGGSFVATGNLTIMSLYVYILSFLLDKADSGRRKGEEAMQASEEKYRGLFVSSRDAIMILQPPFWKFVSANPATIKMFRVRDENAFISFGPWDLSPERQPDGHASAEKAKEMIEAAVREGFRFFEWTHRRLDGEEFPATVLLTRMKLGKEIFLQATVRDITEVKITEEELKRKMEELGRFNKIAVGRELKMIELKEKIKALEEGRGKA